MADFKIRIEDHSGDVLRKLEQNKVKVLEACGQTAATHAKNIITRFSRVDTGAMRNSINHQVQESESAVYVGSNNEYIKFHEYGTGIYLESDDGRQGRQTPWRYQDRDGNWHTTRGIKPIHMLKNSLDHFQADYKKIIKEELKEMEK